MENTFENIMLTFREVAERQAETDRIVRENAEQMRLVFKKMGSWDNNHGNFAEEYFFNSFEQGRKNFFGEEFYNIKKKAPGLNEQYEDEYDILFINGESVGIVEVKFKAHQDHISKVLRKAVTFRENFPFYANHRVYLGFASLVFDEIVEEKCKEEGIVVIKQVGDTVEIYDDNMKAF